MTSKVNLLPTFKMITTTKPNMSMRALKELLGVDRLRYSSMMPSICKIALSRQL